MKKFNFKSYFAGVISTVLVIVLILSVGAATITKTLNATYKDIKISVDGTAIAPKNAAGNAVEPFIVDGNTYLPVRAVADAVGYNVEWDGNTNTVKLTNKLNSQPKSETPAAKPELAFKNSKEVETYIKNNYKKFTYTTERTDGLDTVKTDFTVGIEDVFVTWNSPEKISSISIHCDAGLGMLDILANESGINAAKAYMKTIADDLVSKLSGIEIADASFIYAWYKYPTIKEGFQYIQRCRWRKINEKFEWYPANGDWK